MIAPKGRKYANTTERTLAAEQRIVKVVRGLIKVAHLVEDKTAGDLQRIRAGENLLEDMGHLY